MLPHTATRKGWNRSFGLSPASSPAARQSSSSASASHGLSSSARMPQQMASASSARAPSFNSTFWTLFSSSTTESPQNRNASLAGISSRCARRSATSGYMAS